MVPLAAAGQGMVSGPRSDDEKAPVAAGHQNPLDVCYGGRQGDLMDHHDFTRNVVEAVLELCDALLLKLLTPSPYFMLDHGLMHWYDRIIFSISSHVFNEPQE